MSTGHRGFDRINRTHIRRKEAFQQDRQDETEPRAQAVFRKDQKVKIIWSKEDRQKLYKAKKTIRRTSVPAYRNKKTDGILR
jgi:hypothetical protein